MTSHQVKIAPSLLAADFARLGEEVRAIEVAGADYVHFDVMDNHYVPNLTFGPMVLAAIKPHTNLPLDVHLMVEPVDALIESFAKAGADLISFHPEASRHVDRSLSLIRAAGCKAGLALNPSTPLNHLEHVLDRLDLILVMSVNPGFGGQSFIPQALHKVKAVRDRIGARDILIEVDGGVIPANSGALAAAGADILVAGSSVFGARGDDGDYTAAISALRKGGNQ
ncbi:MAG: ribulose-phosphate 3-epimerase [Alphaproteobacteria bacterium]|nr:ribulose-phosphate 3-epimerase [Alphaproteobacteria bacterium]MDE2042730.1 ribulose-phosphate 3-epimerase [Alphaproteobacteria bacterium]